jgi:acyl-CoA thioester hydrolase
MHSTSDEFRFHWPVAVRFRDIDLGGHAHHSEALMYIEEARAAYWREVAGRSGSDLENIDYVLAEATIRWKQRVLYPDTLDVGVRVSVLGKKHFVMEYEIRSGDGDLLVSVTSTQVMYDYGTGRAKRMEDEVRTRIAAFDGPFE